MQNALNLSRRSVIKTAIASAAACTFPSIQAQSDFPKGQIKIIVPLPAAGAVDISVRKIAQEMEKSLKQPVIVENKPGGLFQIGMHALLAAPADGHTIIAVNMGMVAMQVIQKQYDMNKQLVPITASGETQWVVMVNPKLPFKTMKELIAHAKANPGKLTYSTVGPGSLEHLAIAQMEKLGGFSALMVPYKGGPDAVNAVVKGDVDFTVSASIFAGQFAPKGLLRVIGTMDATRMKEYPDAPTMQESGINLPQLRVWGGFAVHADTPPAIVQRLNQLLSTAINSTAVVQGLAPMGMMAQASKSPEDFRKLIAADAVWMTEAAKGLKLATQ